ncbi:uncharacterized protein LOC129290302 [Prosopis cineraria]|uniref:uncharacterized protein LOC129290302 n=1 Tax=Prosopis cineraria TaxID=364024 RepID=UPI00240F4A98|nr:uncharacterized protein LOC129290302 [Prosopis cineraria]
MSQVPPTHLGSSKLLTTFTSAAIAARDPLFRRGSHASTTTVGKAPGPTCSNSTAVAAETEGPIPFSDAEAFKVEKKGATVGMREVKGLCLRSGSPCDTEKQEWVRRHVSPAMFKSNGI